MDQRGATTGDDALLDRGAGRGDGVLQTVLLLLQLHLGGGADLDHAHAAGQLREALLELLAVPVGVRVVDLGLDLADAALHLGGVTGASTIVVSSLVTVTRRAEPSTSMPTWSSLRPTSSEMTVAPVRTAMSWSIALRRSPKPGALTATALKVPRILLTTRVESASPSRSSAMISSGLEELVWMTFSSSGSRSRSRRSCPG